MFGERRVATVSGHDVPAQLAALRRDYPALYACIDAEKAVEWAEELSATSNGSDDFSAEESGGRGGRYLHAQAINVAARSTGIAAIFRLIRNGTARRLIVADMLGGDGLVSRVCTLLGITDVDIITCDASAHMVEAAWANSLPALLQRAEWPLFRPTSVDAVVFAYGTHHVPRADRIDMVHRAHLTLRSQGVLVLHDFMIGSPADTWFRDIVHPYSATGHEFDHFTADEIEEYITKAGFDSCTVMDIDDPYVAIGDSPEEAELNLGEYLVNMYGLVRAQELMGKQEAFRWAVERGKEIFRYAGPDETITGCSVEYVPERRVWRATLPRKALVGVGRKF
jgi:hypothetical protein